MSGNKQLSKRIQESVKDLIDKFLDTDYVQRVLTTGAMTDANRRVAHQQWKRSRDICPGFLDLTKRTVSLFGNTGNDQTAKQFYQSMAKAIEDIISDPNADRQLFEKIFGKMDDQLPTAPMNKSQTDYTMFMLNVSKLANPLRTSVVVLAIFHFYDTVYHHVTGQSHYIDNPFAKYLLFAGYSQTPEMSISCIQGIVNGMNVSEDECQELIQLARQTIQHKMDEHLGN